MVHILEEILHHVISYGILLFEYIGVIVLIIDGIQGVIGYIKRDSEMRLNLAQGMATALSFKLGGEILRTVIVQTIQEIAVVACIIVLRASLTFLIHWEIKHMEQAKTLEESKAVEDSELPSGG